MKMHYSCFLLLLFIARQAGAVNSYTLEEAAKKGLIGLSIKGKGGYTGRVISVTIDNLQRDSIVLRVEAGRRLDSRNNKEQDILVTRSETFAMAGCQRSTYSLYGMCCQAHNAAPGKNSDFNVGKLADSGLVRLASFINRNRYYNESAAQSAVWVISDKENMASIGGSNEAVTEDLLDCVSGINGKPVPGYTIIYKKGKGTDLRGDIDRIEGKFRYHLTGSAQVVAGIYNSSGRMVQLIEDIKQEEGNYKLFYTFNTDHLPPGSYYLRLMVDGKQGKEEKIEF